jgi:hypothetical protein
MTKRRDIQECKRYQNENHPLDETHIAYTTMVTNDKQSRKAFEIKFHSNNEQTVEYIGYWPSGMIEEYWSGTLEQFQRQLERIKQEREAKYAKREST